MITGRRLTGALDHTRENAIENGPNTFYWANEYNMNKEYLQGKLHTRLNKNSAKGADESQETIARSKVYLLVPFLIFSLLILLFAGNAQGLVSYWKFDENTGTKAQDSSGYGNIGTINGATWTQGKIGSALQFDGVNDYVEGLDSPSLDMTDKITLIAWIKINTIDANPHSIAGKVSGYDFAVRGSNLRFEIIPTDIDSTGINLAANTWYHVAVTYDRSNVIFYKNGVELFRTAKSILLPNGNVFRIGRNQWNEYFNGIIDEVKIYNTTLSASEIEADYLSGTIDTTPPAVSSTNPQNNAVNVPGSKTITVTFSESIQEGTNYSNISLKDSHSNAVSTINSINGNVLTIDPASDLAYSETYTVSIPSRAVRDLSNNILVNQNSFSFTTSGQPILTIITVSPSSASVSKGSTKTFTASPKDQFGDPFTATVNWSSSNTSVGTINSTGEFTALAAGILTITATSGSVSGAAVATVVMKPTQQSVTFASNGISEPFNFINHPHAVYYNNKTYIVWQGANLDPYITYYDHNTRTWGANTRVAENPLNGDSHGAPSIEIDNSGYIYVFYGSHGSNQKYAKSNNPENIGGFTVMQDIAGAYTYPNPIKAGNSLYLFIRPRAGWAYKIFNGNSWGATNTILSSGVYAGFFELNNNKIHMTWTGSYSDGTRRNVYYAYMDLSDPYTPHHLYSASGIDLGNTIDSIKSDTYARVRNTGTMQSNAPSMHIDSNGYPWIIYIEGSGTSYQFYHTRWTGSAWTTPVAITTTDDQWNYADFIINSPTDVTAYVTSTGLTGPAGDIEEWNWDGSAWSKVQIVLSQSISGKPLNAPIVPFNFNPELKLFFCQYLDENFADTTLKIYAYTGE